MANRILGLDIGTKNTKLVLAQTGKKFKILKTYTIETPQGCVIEGEIRNTDMVASAIEAVIADKKLNASGLSFSINLPNALIRDVKLPLLKSNEIEPAVEFELSQSFPGVAQTHTISFKMYRTTGSAIEGIAAFCPTKQLDVYVDLAKKIGIPLKGISVNAETVAKSYNYIHDIGKDTKPVLIIDIGYNTSQVNIVEDDRLLLSRNVSSGVSSIDNIVANRFNISLDKAERARINNKYSIYEINDQDINTINRLGFSAIEDQIRQTLDYYSYNKPKEAISKMIVIGGGSIFNGLEKYLKETFNIPVVYSENKTDYKENLQIYYPAIGACILKDELYADINLIPYLKTMRMGKAQAGRFSLVAAVLGSAFLLSLAAYFGMLLMGNIYSDKEAALDKEIIKYSKVNAIKNSIVKAEDRVAKIDTILENIKKGSFSSSDILKRIGSGMPDTIFSINYTFDGDKIQLTGKSQSRTGISDFIYKLKENIEFESVTVSNITSVMKEDGSIMNYDFIIEIQLLGQVK